MKYRNVWLTGIVLALVPFAAIAQISLPRVGGGLPQIPDNGIYGNDQSISGPLVDPSTGVINNNILDRLSAAELRTMLERLRIDRVKRFLRENKNYVERDQYGDPAVRGVLIATGISESSLQSATAEGFRILERESIDGLGISYVKLAVRPGRKLESEQKKLQKIAREADISADNIYFPSGLDSANASLPIAIPPLNGLLLASGNTPSGAMGLIDGGIARHDAINIAVEQRGFAKGAPSASNHGTAIASLVSANPHRPRRLLAADIYGRDPAGGNATAIVQALGWMAQRQVPVVTISLVGPENPLLGLAISAAQKKGVLIVAAVGNDGPAAPPRFPASYKGVIGVTGVDRRERALPEAGIRTPVDFAAPGADLKGASPDGKIISLRGTSFAAPLVAARLAVHYPSPDITRIRPSINALIREAKDLGKKGPDKIFGNGLICGKCGLR
ncbi:S8 family serine peptidase [Parasphingorhabdus sp. JC815]|uniref:S8 family serine peptidase n=1 Tax=Parasphingorhabdus sp. JC815 TaxID=3232140 RepID=UPI0034589CB3